MSWVLAILILMVGVVLGGGMVAFMKGANYPCEDCVLVKDAEERLKNTTAPPSEDEEEDWDAYAKYSDLPKRENIRKRHK